MGLVRLLRTLRIIPFLIAVCFVIFPAQAQYSGGSGTPDDPYQIATAADLIALGEAPDDYDKHFILTADIDLDANLPGRKVFDRAVIASNTDDAAGLYFAGTSFRGVFDGNDHVVRNLTIAGEEFIGLFGELRWGEVRSLGLVDATIVGSGYYVGGLVGRMGGGWVTRCYSTGMVAGESYVGGLIGRNGVSVGMMGDVSAGVIDQCWSTASVKGSGGSIGGLVGSSWGGEVRCAYAAGSVTGNHGVGGLVGSNGGSGNEFMCATARISQCYATGTVFGANSSGGLVGAVGSRIMGPCSEVVASFYNSETSGQMPNGAGTGKTTAEMQIAITFVEAGWDFAGETENGTKDTWKIVEGQTYPLLSWQKYGGGTGEPNDPYLIYTPEHLNALGAEPNDYDKHFILTADIDLDPNLPGNQVFDRAVIAPAEDPPYFVSPGLGPPFVGVFDGGGHTISNMTIMGGASLGLFGCLAPGAVVSNLGLHEMEVNGTGGSVGGLAGSGGIITNCHSTGKVSGDGWIGGLVGAGATITNCYSSSTVTGTVNVGGLVGADATVTNCYSSSTVTGIDNVGGLVGDNSFGDVSYSCSTGTVKGDQCVGGLVGLHSCGGFLYEGDARIAYCYSLATVSGRKYVGGLVGSVIAECYETSADIYQCYSAGAVRGEEYVGGFVGDGGYGGATTGFWDIENSGQANSDGGAGVTTAQMKDPNTFITAGWDFVGQADGPHDIWAMPEDGGYPVLFWQLPTDFGLPAFSGGTGEPNAPYLISTAEQLNGLGHNPRLMKCHFRLVADLDMTGVEFYPIGDEYFSYEGVFDGNDHTISHMTVEGGILVGDGRLPGSPPARAAGGLFGILAADAIVRNLGVTDVSVTGYPAGALVGYSLGHVSQCYSSSTVSGDWRVGGLVGENYGSITSSYSTGSVSGETNIGGLVGENYGSITTSHSSCAVTGTSCGGLVGGNTGDVIDCYSTGTVTGTAHRFDDRRYEQAGGLVGENYGSIATSYSSGTITGGNHVGGLVGLNFLCGSVTSCYCKAAVTGGLDVGGLAGLNTGDIRHCYAMGSVVGDWMVGGLVGENGVDGSEVLSDPISGTIVDCYSVASVSGNEDVGGLAGGYVAGRITNSFWDTERSGQTASVGGTDLTTAEMQTASTFLEAGWDFIDETENGTDDIWWILEGQDYPRLWWERGDGHPNS